MEYTKDEAESQQEKLGKNGITAHAWLSGDEYAVSDSFIISYHTPSALLTQGSNPTIIPLPVIFFEILKQSE